jgi:hypothetical protein
MYRAWAKATRGGSWSSAWSATPGPALAWADQKRGWGCPVWIEIKTTSTTVQVSPDRLRAALAGGYRIRPCRPKLKPKPRPYWQCRSDRDELCGHKHRGSVAATQCARRYERIAWRHGFAEEWLVERVPA